MLKELRKNKTKGHKMKIKGNKRNNKELRWQLKEIRGQSKEIRGTLESIFWKVIFSGKLSLQKASVSLLKSVWQKCKKTVPQRGCPTRTQNSANPSK